MEDSWTIAISIFTLLLIALIIAIVYTSNYKSSELYFLPNDTNNILLAEGDSEYEIDLNNRVCKVDDINDIPEKTTRLVIKTGKIRSIEDCYYEEIFNELYNLNTITFENCSFIWSYNLLFANNKYIKDIYFKNCVFIFTSYSNSKDGPDCYTNQLFINSNIENIYIDGVTFNFKWAEKRVDFTYLCLNCANLKTINFSNVKIEKSDSPVEIDLSYAFAYCSNLQNFSINDFECENNNICLLTEGMFYECEKIETVNLGKLCISPRISYMFYNCKLLKEITINETNDVNNINAECDYTCSGCESLEKFTISNFIGNFRNAGSSCENMFYRCYALEEVTINADEEFGLNCVTNMFYECRSLKTISMKNFNFNYIANSENFEQKLYY